MIQIQIPIQIQILILILINLLSTIPTRKIPKKYLQSKLNHCSPPESDTSLPKLTFTKRKKQNIKTQKRHRQIQPNLLSRSPVFSLYPSPHLQEKNEKQPPNYFQNLPTLLPNLCAFCCKAPKSNPSLPWLWLWLWAKGGRGGCWGGGGDGVDKEGGYGA